MKMVYDSRGDLMFVKEVVEGGVLASLEEVDEPVQFLPDGSYYVYSWDVGQSAVSLAYLVNGRHLATCPDDVNRILGRLFGAHFAIRRAMSFYANVVPGTFRGTLGKNGWSGTFKTYDGEEYVIQNGVTDGIAWRDAKAEELAFDFDIEPDPEDLAEVDA